MCGLLHWNWAGETMGRARHRDIEDTDRE
jgi:hypothetical protein